MKAVEAIALAGWVLAVVLFVAYLRTDELLHKTWDREDYYSHGACK